MAKPKWVLTKKKLKKLRKKDDGAPLESYAPLGQPSVDMCSEDGTMLGREWEPENTVAKEIGEGPVIV